MCETWVPCIWQRENSAEMLRKLVGRDCLRGKSEITSEGGAAVETWKVSGEARSGPDCSRMSEAVTRFLIAWLDPNKGLDCYPFQGLA